MTQVFGVNLPTIEISGFLSGTWIYILIIALLGFIILVALSILLFFMTYKRKVVIFENISGAGYQPVKKTRARIVKVGKGGEEVLKTLAGSNYLTAYGRKMGKNTYYFAKGPDGYLYNIILGDLDAKMSILDIEPIDRDVRMFRVALDRLSHLTYDKKKFFEKYGVHLLLFAFLVVMILGMWFIVHQVGKAIEPLGKANEKAEQITETNLRITERLSNLITQLKIKEPPAPTPEQPLPSGLEPAG